jgi:hypothetical protein
MSRPQGHGAAGRINQLKKSNDLIGNRTRDFPACSIVHLILGKQAVIMARRPGSRSSLTADFDISGYDPTVLNLKLRWQAASLRPCYKRDSA